MYHTMIIQVFHTRYLRNNKESRFNVWTGLREYNYDDWLKGVQQIISLIVLHYYY